MLPIAIFKTTPTGTIIYQEHHSNKSTNFLSIEKSAFMVISFNFIFAIWHIPELYDYSVKYHWIHVSEHILFIFSSIIMWWPLCSKSPEVPRIPYPLQMIYLFVMSLSQIIVFGIITFSTEPLYDHYINAPRLWDITPLLDQQLGGIIMKVGSGFLFLFLLIIVFFKWFKESTTTVE